MLSKAEIRREVEKRSSSYTAMELFSSADFADMLQATVTSVCEKLGRIPSITTVCDPKSDLTACTQGSKILLNTQGPLIRSLKSNWEMYVSNIGHITHECGHVLFTDFEHQNRMIEGWLHDTFTFYPERPDLKGADEIGEYLNKVPFFRAVFLSCMRRIENSLEDAYVENRLRMNFGGLAVAGLEKANEALYECAPSLNESLDACLNGQILPITVADSIILSRYVVGKEMKKEEALNEAQKGLFDFINAVLDSAKTEMDNLCFEQDGRKRCELFNRLLVKFFFLMPPPPKESEKPEEGDSSGSNGKGEQKSESKSGESDYSQQLSEAMDRAGANEEAKSGKSKEPSGCTSSIKQKEEQGQKEEAKSRREESAKLGNSQGAMERELLKAIKDAVKAQVLKEDELKHAKELKKEVKALTEDIKPYEKGSTFQGYQLNRNDGNRASYMHIYADVAASAKNLTRKINNVLKDRETDSVESGFLMGQRFNATDVVRRDGKYFSRQIVPDGKPEVVFGILVDESGSMSRNGKDERARKAAILIEDALRNLGTPLMVVGHTEKSWGTCILNVYADFDTSDGQDKYRLANIHASGGNIDGAAITYISEKLLKRPEKTKVLLVISDGLPAGSSFYNENPNEDTRMAVEKYRKKNLNIFGAVVDQFEQVSSIYGDQFSFDCRDSGSLERELVKLIKKYVLLR